MQHNTDLTFCAAFCTRENKASPQLASLIHKLYSGNIETYALVGKESIFNAYSDLIKLLEKSKPLNSIVILCHDDISILTDIHEVKQILASSIDDKTGFCGVAGTTYLTSNAVWWERSIWKEGFHRGTVYHKNMEKTYYGPTGRVVVLDGLFLAARLDMLLKLNLEKPPSFSGEWDFYDLHYTLKAHLQGLENKVVPIELYHASIGELAGRDSWHANRSAFIGMHYNLFPIYL